MLYRLDFLRSLPDYKVSEIHVPLWTENTGRYTPLGLVGFALRALTAHASIFFHLIRAAKADIAYVPYPAPSILLLLAGLPSNRAPRLIIADAFISLYDTVVNDRRLLSPGSLPAKILFRLERWAYTLADCLIVDTAANAEFFRCLFLLDEEKLRALPLSTNEIDYQPSPYLPHAGPIKVLFIGTLIPLHGITTIIEAAVRLRHRLDIEFLVIGDGQAAPEVTRLLDRYHPNLIWQRRWQTPKELAANITDADICLGIFGDTAKAKRVCPYKIYAYATVGRAVITARGDWRDDAPPDNTFAMVPPADPVALAEEIVALSENPVRRIELAQASRRYYEQTLSNTISHHKLLDYLAETGGDEPGPKHG